MYLSNPGSASSASASTGKASLKALFVLLFVLGTSTAFGQFSLDLGASGLLTNSRTVNVRDRTPNLYSNITPPPVTTYYYSYTYNAEGVGVFLYPKFAVAKTDALNFTIGTPINLGFTMDEYTGRTSFAVDLNVAAGVVGGRYTKQKEDDAPFGYYVGIGYGYTKTSISGYEMNTDILVDENSPNLMDLNQNEQELTELFDTKTTAPFIEAGIGSFAFMENIGFFSGTGLRFAYKPAMTKTDLSYYTITLVIAHFH